MDKNNFTPEESLQLISKTIEETKKNVMESGHMMILWGSITCVVFGSQYIFSLTGLYKHFDIIWTTILFPLGAIYSYFYISKTIKKKNLPKTILGRIFSTMGWVLGINMMVLGFFFGHQIGIALAPIFLVFWAFFIILVGVSIKFKPLLIGGILLNLIGFGTFLINRDYHGLSLIVGSLLGLIIPGILLNLAKNREHV